MDALDKNYGKLMQLDPTKDSIENILEFISLFWDFNYGDMNYTLPPSGTNDKEFSVEFHTGGWSENETVIQALSQSWFWKIFWWKSERGGHFWLKVKKIPKGRASK